MRPTERNIDYEKLTEEQLEEMVEDIDWSQVPGKILTPYIKEQFGELPEAKARIWFEDLFKLFQTKTDYEKYDHVLFFFIGDKYHMELDKTTYELFLHPEFYYKICELIYGRRPLFGKETKVMERFIRNIMEQYIFETDIKIRICISTLRIKEKENHFKEKVKKEADEKNSLTMILNGFFFGFLVGSLTGLFAGFIPGLLIGVAVSVIFLGIYSIAAD